MKILGIDSSGKVAGVALMEEEKLIAEYTLNLGLTHSQTLLPMIAQVLETTSTETEEIDLIAVSCGPGSFTGLRIGAATAKGLALAHQTKMVHISTLEALAFNAMGSEALVCPIMDARRSQVYTAVYDCRGEKPKMILEECAMGMEELIAYLNKQNMPVVFLGDGVEVYKKQIRECMKAECRFMTADRRLQKAASVAALGFLHREEAVSSNELALSYIRKPQAEREREEQGLRVYDITHEKRGH